PKEVLDAFNKDFLIIEKKGYSIIYPSWPRASFFPSGLVTNTLWRIDQFLNRTFLWKFGEYSLYVFKMKK
ncbi:MAG: hypothetical protein ACFFG0_53045, partial [Candidatus Thorarchaeota archaeon]